MTVAEVLADARDRMGKAVEAVKEDFGSVRTGRANPALFQKVMVEYYGSPTPLGQLASMNNPEARTLIVTPYDKTALKEIEKALVNVPNLSATVGNDGEMVRLTLPELTEDRRKEFVKIVRGKAEEGRVSVRNIRRRSKDELDALKGEVGDDEVARGEKELEALTKTHTDQVDDALKRKETELLEV
ncbi:ribosome recycling factor [Clavibacter michiganensis]|uniref:Ribosome-recycling factor n=6 Tax=Clavibacter TaxID=1573 RepID=A0A399NUR3_9MICO|nr:ribosome recycling factor [Clavibacter cf. michiganensis LMG 26808]MBF4623972.1 ribosome recycling factor [Clavibacter sp. VKM Ac-2872]MBM7410562.1 ribosome recycling factor [Clavibacter michiganensis]QGV66540.1 ribosome recycling factor [Clavibacter nebraskensis]RIJ51806.1 ribosome-recycling factor [Clavibacter lycopersici]RIJ55911.1 ribosome-recycling factor [Clavibacter phaseoli]CCE75309.1 frr [Clavibacter nebraskensis NCPPB 2581]